MSNETHGVIVANHPTKQKKETVVQRCSVKKVFF